MNGKINNLTFENKRKNLKILNFDHFLFLTVFTKLLQILLKFSKRKTETDAEFSSKQNINQKF